MNKLKFNILIAFALLISTIYVHAMSVSPASMDLVYDPAEGLDTEFTLRLGVSTPNTDYIQLELVRFDTPFGIPDGASLMNISQMNKYVTLSSYKVDVSKSNTVTVRVKIPPNEKLYGLQYFAISAKEVPKGSSGFLTVTTGILFRVAVDAPYPNQYLDIVKFSIDNVNEGESSKLYWQVKGRSEQATKFDASLEIKSKEGLVVFTRDLGGGSVFRHGVFPPDYYYESLPTNTFTPGAYEGILTVKFLSNIKKSTVKFNVGTESAVLDNYNPKNLIVGEINEVSFTVRNLWNGAFMNTYCSIEIYGENQTTVKATTPSGALSPFGTLELKQFVDIRALPEGNYAGKITLNFDSNSATYPAQFSITKKIIPVVVEEKEGMSSKTLMLIGLSIGAIIIIILVFLLVFRRKSGESSGKEEKTLNVSQKGMVKGRR